MLSDVKKTLNKRKKKKKDKKIRVSKQKFRTLSLEEERSLFKQLSFPLSLSEQPQRTLNTFYPVEDMLQLPEEEQLPN